MYTELAEDFAYPDVADADKVIVNLCEDIHARNGELTVTDSHVEDTRINYVGRAHFDESAAPAPEGIQLQVNANALGDLFDKEYDGKATAAGEVAVTGATAGDDVSCLAALTFADKNVGRNKAVHVEFRLTGTDAGKYIAPAALDTTGRIHAKQAYFKVEYSGRDYVPGNTIIKLDNAYLTNYIGSDDVRISSKDCYGTIASDVAGTHDVSFAHVKLQGEDAKNYDLHLPNNPKVVITRANQATLSLIAASAVYDPAHPVSLSTAGGSGTGAVSYTIAGGSGEGTINGSDLTVTKCGTFTLKADNAGDGNYLLVQSAPVTITISKADQAALDYTGATNVTYTPAAPYAASSSGGTAGATSYTMVPGTGVGTLSGSELTVTKAGTFTFTAHRAETDLYNAVDCTPVTITISKANQAALNFTGAVSDTYNPAAPYAASSSGGTAGATSYTMVPGTGAGTLSGSALTVTKTGTFTFTAHRAETDLYNAVDSAPVQVTINRANQAALNFTGALSDTYNPAAPYAASSSGGTVGATSYTMVPGTGAGTLNGSELTVTKAGTFTFTAHRAQTDLYNAVDSTPAQVTINKATQTILVTPDIATRQVGVPVTLSASTPSTGATTLASTGCTVNQMTVTPNVTGNLDVTVSNAGDNLYAQNSTTFTLQNVVKAVQTAALSATSQSVPCIDRTSVYVTGKVGDGAVTYSLSNNTASATVNASGAVTFGKAGSVTVTANIAETNTVYSGTTNAVTITATPVAPAITSLNASVGELNTSNFDYAYTITPTITNPSGNENYPLSLVNVSIKRTSSEGGYTTKNAGVNSTSGRIYPGTYTITYQVENSVGQSNIATTTLNAPVTASSSSNSAHIANGVASFNYSGSLVISSYSFIATTSSGHSTGEDSWYVTANGATIDSGNVGSNVHRIDSGKNNLLNNGYTRMEFVYRMGAGHESCAGDASYSVTLAIPRYNGNSD